MSKAESVRVFDVVAEISPTFAEIIRSQALNNVYGAKNVTYLVPDEKLADKLLKLVKSQNLTDRDLAIKALQCCFIAGRFDSADRFRDKVVLSKYGAKINGLKVENLSLHDSSVELKLPIFVLSNEFPSLDSAEVSPEEKVIIARNNAYTLFTDTVKTNLQKLIYNPKQTTIINFLVELHNACDTNGKYIIASQLSYDWFATFIVIVKPFYTKNNHPYACVISKISQLFERDAMKKWKSGDKTEAYLSIMNAFDRTTIAGIDERLNKSAKIITTLNIVSEINKYYSNIIEKNKNNARFANMTPDLMFAEAEIRIISFNYILREGETMASVMNVKYNMEAPYICNENTIVKVDNMTYYSVFHSISRSDALVYAPGSKYEDVDSVFERDTIPFSMQNTKQLQNFFENDED